LWHVGWCLGDLGFPYFGANSGRWWRHTVSYTSLLFFPPVWEIKCGRTRRGSGGNEFIKGYYNFWDWEAYFGMLWVMLLLPGYVWEQLDYQILFFSDTGSQLAVLTLLNFFILSSDYWKYFTGQFACHCWCSYLAVVIIIRDLDVCGYHA